MYLSLGGALAYTVGGGLPQLEATNVGAQKVIFGAFGLPLGLGLIIICGAELYTTNAAWLPAAVYEGRANMTQLCKSWFFSFFGNLAGSLIVVWLLDEVRRRDPCQPAHCHPALSGLPLPVIRCTLTSAPEGRQ